MSINRSITTLPKTLNRITQYKTLLRSLSSSTARKPPPPIPDSDPFVPPKSPFSSPKLEHQAAVTPLPHPTTTHQKRTLIDVGCDAAGVDVGKGAGRTDEEKRSEDAEFFGKHKASALENVEIADTRKPITRATDSSVVVKGELGVVVWKPEQLETADETMAKVAEMWWRRKAMGDPESPHGRVLRQLRGEL